MKNYIKLFIILCSFIAITEAKKPSKKTIKSIINEKYETLKEKFTYDILLPMIIKYEEVKEEGFSNTDYAIIASTSALIGSCITYYNWNFLTKNKRPIIATSITAAALIAMYKIYKNTISNENSIDYKINKFIQRLSKEKQSKIFNNPDLLSLLADSSQDPNLLFTSTKFCSILDENEIAELKKIINPELC